MSDELSIDTVSLSELRANATRVVQRAAQTGRVRLTRRGKPIAVLQSLSEYESTQEEASFMKAVVAGVVDLEAGLAVSLDEVKRRLLVGKHLR